ncbi:MAG: NAD(P)/FAD-dependent oxidoreductase [candidate division WOR-3 bacterium]|nr:MAG: NAD(P)/FAD-dependent oxidoreductase [candidate division WOR-3 bacterium]
MERFDIIVIGAGPAGSAAAYTAARHGVSVLLLEEHPKIGIPVVCAEGISRKSIAGYLDIEQGWISQHLNGAIIRGPHDQEFRIDYPGCGWILDRATFDPALARMAENAGVQVKTRSKVVGIHDRAVTVAHEGRTAEYGYNFVIGADGMKSRVGTWFDVDTRLAVDEITVCAEYLLEDINVDPSYVELLFGERYAPGAYAWIFPKSSSSANVGLGVSPVRTRRRAREILDEWIKREFPSATVKQKIFGGVSAKVLERFSGNRFYLVGDAARLTDPLSGAGIANGIKSGVIAGRSAVARMKGKKDAFHAELKKAVLKEIAYNQGIRNVYLKLMDSEYEHVFRIAKRILSGHAVSGVSIRRIAREVMIFSPLIFKSALKLLFR